MIHCFNNFDAHKRTHIIIDVLDKYEIRVITSDRQMNEYTYTVEMRSIYV